MAANDTPATAIDITTVPYSITLDPAGPEQLTDIPSCVGSSFSAVWWKYTVPTNVSAIGIRIALGVGTNYYPELTLWTGTPGSLTEVPNTCISFWDPTTNQFSLTPGITYYFQVVDGNENDPPPTAETITFEVEEAPIEISPAGSLLISNDIANCPTCILDATDGSILRVLGLPSFECADILPSGIIGCASENDDGSFAIESFEIFNQDLSLDIAVTSVVIANQATVSPVTTNLVDTFYFARPSKNIPASYTTTIKKIADDGTVDGTTWTLPADGNNTEAIAVKADGSILYYCDNKARSGGTTPGAIHAYDLLGSAPLTDLVATTAGSKNGRDLILLTDDTLLVVFCPNASGAPNTWQVKQYNLAGALLNTFSVPSTSGSPPRICRGLDDPDSFWVMTFPTGSPVNSVFTNIKISDGSTITTLTVLQRKGGDEDGPMFGPAQSCPLLLLPLEVEPPVSNGNLIVGKASGSVIGATFTVQSPGLTPTSFSIGFEGTQEFLSIPAGTYSIIEDPDPTYLPTYYVSNDPVNNDNTAIVVGAGETVDVVIVNVLKTQFGGLYILNPQLPKTNDTVVDQNLNLVDKIINWFWQLFIARDK